MPGDVWTLLGMLAAVVAILAVAYWCTRLIAQRGMTVGTQGVRTSGELCVLGQINIGKGERLVLIRLHERCFLIGVTAGNISILTELTVEESGVWLAQTEQKARTPSFIEALRGTISKKK